MVDGSNPGRVISYLSAMSMALAYEMSKAVDVLEPSPVHKKIPRFLGKPKGSDSRNL